KGNKTPPTAQILPATVLSMVEMLLPSKVTAAMQTTATRDSSRPYSTKEAPSSSRTNLVWAARSLVMELSPGQGLERSAASLASRSGSPLTGRPVQLVGTLQASYLLTKQHPCRSSPGGAPNCERTCRSRQVGSELLVAAQLRSSELKGIASRAIFFVNDSCGGRHAECKRRLTLPCTRRRLAPRIVDTERPYLFRPLFSSCGSSSLPCGSVFLRTLLPRADLVKRGRAGPFHHGPQTRLPQVTIESRSPRHESIRESVRLLPAINAFGVGSHGLRELRQPLIPVQLAAVIDEHFESRRVVDQEPSIEELVEDPGPLGVLALGLPQLGQELD